MRLLLMSVLLCFSPAAAAAQPQSATDAARLSVSGIGGIAIGDQHSPIVAAQAGWRVANELYITGEVGWIQNVLSGSLSDEIDVVGRLLSLQSGSDMSFDARLHSRYVAGGVRWMHPVRRVGVFAEGGVGAAFLGLSIDTSGADQSTGRTLEAELRHDAPDSTSGTHMMGVIGGGVTIALRSHWQLDGGYRYIWITTDPRLHVQVPYAALRVMF